MEERIREHLEGKGLHPHFLRVEGSSLRALACNSWDSKYAARLALYSIFALMSGYTFFALSESCHKLVLLPLEQVEGNPTALLTRHSESWQRLVGATGQPPLLNMTI